MTQVIQGTSSAAAVGQDGRRPAGAPGPRRRARPLRRRLGVSLAAGLVGIAMAELVAGIYLTRYASPRVLARYGSSRQVMAHDENEAMMAKHTYLGYYPRPGFERPPNQHNSLGFRGVEFQRAKPPGELRIVCIGGSTTYGPGVQEHHLSYPAILEAVLRRRGHESVRVINSGCGGWTTYESLINLHLRVLDLEPDLLIVLHSVNDILARIVWPPERYLGDNSGSRGAGSEIFMPSLREHSALWRFLAVSRGWMTPHATIERSLNRQPPWFHGLRFGHQVTSGTYPSAIFAEVPAQRMLDANRPVHYRRNLTEIVRTAHGRGIACVLTSFHYVTTDPRTLSATREYRGAYLEHERIQRQIAAEEGAHYFDLHSQLSVEPRYFYDDVHLTAEGNRRKAVLYADFIEAEGLLSR